MIEMKQIQYFAACAQTGSFSRAAEILFTTQPSVSRVIKSMEDELGVQLFERHTKGIGLTRAGENIYQYAAAVLENVQKMQVPIMEERIETLHVSTNPSSWFADTFLEFYREHQGEKLHYQIYSIGTNEVVQRVQDRRDDIGFVYVMKNQLSAFLFFISRNYLEFEELCRTDIMIHPGRFHECWTHPECGMSFDRLKLVQRFPDEFSPDNYWDIQDGEGNPAADAETVVVTNSDYIMQRLLAMSDLVNISGAYLTAEKEGRQDGRRVSTLDDDQILFGCLKRKGEELPAHVCMFLEYVREKLR